ncbi:hypothetical protein [Viridibacillus sp. FSL H7-0596]|uniref:hypothetical protein n=1 Tax=Viridibacillus sp. FSL H7-0596 TaxID=1928923 RepID=UPI001180CABA|nr:hypothetical protein [Viridibacillus sp. FSL H7-0596]
MMEFNKTQTCPHCSYEVDDSQAHWEEDEQTIECESCGTEYIVKAVYEFKGFQTERYCTECEVWEDECFCEGESFK